MRIEERLLSLERLILCSTKKVLNTEECAKYLNVSADRVRHMVTNKEIPCYKFKGKNYFNREELEATIMQDRQPTQTEIEAEAMKYVLNKK